MSPLKLGTPATYRITIQGAIQGSLDDSWSSDFGGMAITHTVDADGHALTVLSGWLVDQAALFGVLNGLYGLGFPLCSVECLEIKALMKPSSRARRDTGKSPTMPSSGPSRRPQQPSRSL